MDQLYFSINHKPPAPYCAANAYVQMVIVRGAIQRLHHHSKRESYTNQLTAYQSCSHFLSAGIAAHAEQLRQRALSLVTFFVQAKKVTEQ